VGRRGKKGKKKKQKKERQVRNRYNIPAWLAAYRCIVSPRVSIRGDCFERGNKHFFLAFFNDKGEKEKKEREREREKRLEVIRHEMSQLLRKL